MIDPKLIEIFEYHFGIDITQPKYDEGRQELAEFFSNTVAKSITDFYALTEVKTAASTDPDDNTKPSGNA